MIKRVSNCYGCGQRPCMNCSALELWCDSCNNETDELYDCDGEQYCLTCYKVGTFADSVVFNNKAGSLSCECCGEEPKKLYRFEDEADWYCKDCFIDYINENAEPIDYSDVEYD